MVFLLVLVLTVTVLPLIICYQLSTYHALTKKSPATKEQLSWVALYLLPLYCVKFFLNPILYAWRLEKYRSSFMAVFRKPEQASIASARLQPMATVHRQHPVSRGENLDP